MVPDDGGVDPHVLKAIAKAWSWRRKLDSGTATTIQDIAQAEGISDRYVGRMLKLAFLAPSVLEKLLIQRMSPVVSIKDLAMAAELPWGEQNTAAFD
jgi:ParB-like chromosome segregation protein Spo0J